MMAQRYGAYKAVTSWQTDNEFGCHDTVESYSENARIAFRLWLEDKYKTIEALNAAWGNVFWSMEYRRFAEIDLPNQTVTEPNPSHHMPPMPISHIMLWGILMRLIIMILAGMLIF